MEMLKKISSLLTVVAALGMGAVILQGCEEQGPAESAGERLDNAAENLGDNVDDAGDNLRDAADDAQDAAEDAADDMTN